MTTIRVSIQESASTQISTLVADCFGRTSADSLNRGGLILGCAGAACYRAARGQRAPRRRNGGLAQFPLVSPAGRRSAPVGLDAPRVEKAQQQCEAAKSTASGRDSDSLSRELVRSVRIGC